MPRRLSLMITALCALAAQCSAQVHVQTLTAPDFGAGDFFGFALAMDSDTLVVGAQYNSTDVNKGGAVYVYARNPDTTWSYVERLTAPTPAADDNFGSTIALDGDLLVVGVPNRDPGAVFNGGSVVVFRQQPAGTFDFEDELSLLVPDTGDYFGRAVAVSNGVIAVGAERDSTTTADAGAVYIYNKDSGSWAPEITLTHAGMTGLGGSLSFDADTLAVGAPADATNTGSVLITKRDAPGVWTEQIDIFGYFGYSGIYFGASVELKGDLMLVGATNFTTDIFAPTGYGATFVYRRVNSVWTQQQRIEPTGTYAGSTYGSSTVISDGDAIVIAQSFLAGFGTGRFYTLFPEFSGNFNSISTTLPPIIVNSTAFSHPLAMSGRVLAVGQAGNDELANDAGAVHLYEIGGLPGDCNDNLGFDLYDITNGIEADCNDNLVPDSCDIANGTSLDANGNGIPDECESPPACVVDINGDGFLDNGDIIAFITLFLAGC